MPVCPAMSVDLDDGDALHGCLEEGMGGSCGLCGLKGKGHRIPVDGDRLRAPSLGEQEAEMGGGGRAGAGEGKGL